MNLPDYVRHTPVEIGRIELAKCRENQSRFRRITGLEAGLADASQSTQDILRGLIWKQNTDTVVLSFLPQTYIQCVV